MQPISKSLYNVLLSLISLLIGGTVDLIQICHIKEMLDICPEREKDADKCKDNIRNVELIME